MLPRIARLLAPYKGSLLLVALAVVVAAVVTSIAPFLTKAVFDKALFPPGGGPPDLPLLTWLVVGLIAIPLISAVIGIGQNYLTSKVGNSAMADLRSSLFEHLQRMELAFFTATKTGAIQSRLANDVNGVRTVLTSTATTILANVVTVTAALISMIILSWQLTIITLILMPIFIFVQVRVGRRRQRLARRTQESLSEMTAITEESLSVSGILLAKVFNRADVETQRYRRENQRQTRLQVKASMTGQSFFALVSTFFAITPAIIYFVSGRMLGNDAALTAGTLVAFTTLQARLQMPLMQLMRVSLDVQTSLALFRRIFEYLDLVPAIQERPGAIAVDPKTLRGMVELRDVWFRYPPPRQLSEAPASSRLPTPGGRAGGGGGGGGRMGLLSSGGGETVLAATVAADSAITDEQQAESTLEETESPGRDAEPLEPVGASERWALTGLTLRVEPGQLAAIVGPSGSGKTTATYLIPRFYDVDRGACLIDGIDVRDITMGSLADTVGMVTQEPYLFHGTIRDNLAYARPDASQDEIEQAARDANIHDKIMSFEQGYETITGERGYRLSGGEKQRLAIARVLLMNPRVLILDEATSALDTETERLVQEALERATQNRTTIAIAHRLSTIQNADVIFGLEDGRLVEQGTHDELLAHGGLYWRLYTEQFGGGQVEARLADGIKFTDGTVLCDHGPHVHTDVRV
ncbi:ATP-binding cassette subfamily B protein [Allocatelliglobosispora scoriae]|uniref:ATP-binding cassette subfamily B protein n=1 Tax=Allocatelliglobosispora scoriae TaxID=643052 RepID=A0A841BJX2_9ACTN|nr:ABC transporter ATP-binding protein [Allocatelliglobosispora scoriae]MBB5869397.1 ATP-binding cassette subfamily B protein [Allocatelliglobosispora scoriae]